MLRPRAAGVCYSVLGHVRCIVRRAFPLPASQLSQNIPGHARQLTTYEQRRNTPTQAGRRSTVSSGLQTSDFSRVHCSFEDQPCDMRHMRQELIRQMEYRFPRISVKMPMYGPLLRKDITLSPSNSPAAVKYLDDRFDKCASTIMTIPETIEVNKAHVSRHKTKLKKEFEYSIFFEIKDRNVFLTARKKEIEKLKDLAEELVLPDLYTEIPGHARPLTSYEQSQNTPTHAGNTPNHAGARSSVSPGMQTEDFSRVRCSFEDQPCDLRNMRQELIRQMEYRFPRVSVKMPMYGPLLRKDITLSPSNSPAAVKYLDDRFNNSASTTMTIPETIEVAKAHVLRHKERLKKEFEYSIFFGMKDRNVFLTAHKSEIEKLKALAEELVLPEVISDVSPSVSPTQAGKRSSGRRNTPTQAGRHSSERRNTPTQAGRHSSVSPVLQTEDFSRIARCSFKDQPCDLRSMRQELIRQMKYRFPRVSVKMPMYGPLSRKDIILSPSNSPAAVKYLDNRFDKYASTTMTIPDMIEVDQEHVLRHKTKLKEEFGFSIFFGIKDRNVFLTAHISEIEKLKHLAEELVLPGLYTEVISDVSEEMFSVIRESFNHLVPAKLEQFTKPALFEEGSIILQGSLQVLPVISKRVKQLVKYHSDPIKDSLEVPTTLLTSLLISQLKEEELKAKFPSITVILRSGKDNEILISGQCPAELYQFKDWFQEFIDRDYCTEILELDKYQTALVKRILRPQLKNGTAILLENSEQGSSLEITSFSSKITKLLSSVKSPTIVKFDNPVIAEFLRVRGGDLLQITSAILHEDAVIYFGGSETSRGGLKDKLESIINGLFIQEITLPHEVLSSIVVSEIMSVRDQYPGVISIMSDDSTKITILAESKKRGQREKVREFADYLRKGIEGLDVVEYSKSKASALLFRLDDPKLNSYVSQNQVSMKKVTSSDTDMDSWLIYGKKENVRIFLDLVDQLERDSLIGKITKNIKATDYASWHNFMLYAREINQEDGTIRCLFNDRVQSPPGEVSILGPAEDVETMYQNFVSLQLKQALERDSNDLNDPDKSDDLMVTEVCELTPDDLKIANAIQFSFPNTKISTNTDKSGLLVKSDCLASVKLAKEYIENYFGSVDEQMKFNISPRHWRFLSDNWDSIKDALDGICRKSGVIYKRNLEERTITLYGLAANTTTAKENIDSYFLKNHQLHHVLEYDGMDSYETVEIDKNKLEAILDPRVGNFRRANKDVSVQALLGKIGSEKSYLRLSSATENMLQNSIASLRRTEAEIFLKKFHFNDSLHEYVKVLETASPNYSWLFPNDKRKIRVKLDKDSPHFNFAYKSSADLDEAEMVLKKHLDSLELIKEIDIPSKKMGKIMEEISEYIETTNKEEQHSLKVIISETENKILVFGKVDEVYDAAKKLYKTLGSGIGRWESFEVRLDGCSNIETAVKIRAKILKLFPYLMVERIPDQIAPDSEIVLKISTIVKRMEQYPATKMQLNQLIEAIIAENPS